MQSFEIVLDFCTRSSQQQPAAAGASRIESASLQLRMADNLPTPPSSLASPAASFATHAQPSSDLPSPRRYPLRPGSHKEISLINYVDAKVLRIQRRYGKKFGDMQQHDDASGYNDMHEVIQDIDPLIDIVWVSGTRKWDLSPCCLCGAFK